MKRCIICGNENTREEKKTCSDKCAKIFIRNLVKPDLDNYPSLKSTPFTLTKSYLSRARSTIATISRRGKNACK